MNKAWFPNGFPLLYPANIFLNVPGFFGLQILIASTGLNGSFSFFDVIALITCEYARGAMIVRCPSDMEVNMNLVGLLSRESSQSSS